MKKYVLVFACFLMASTSFSQKLITRSGDVKFDASMPDLVEIAGKSATASAILDQTTGDFATSVLVKSFKFKAPLMEEHFNENYMESTKYPNATFKGKILNFVASKLTASKSVYEVEGDLTIHGVTKKIKTKISLALVGGKVNAISNFSVKAADYKIEIPSLVKEKFAENIKVFSDFTLEGK